jgi:hypothetical protein
VQRYMNKMSAGVFRLWIWGLTRAAHKHICCRGYEGTNQQAYNLEAGELLWRTKRICTECGLHRTVVDKYKDFLLNTLCLLRTKPGGEKCNLEIVEFMGYSKFAQLQDSKSDMSPQGSVKFHRQWLGTWDRNKDTGIRAFIPNPVFAQSSATVVVAMYLWLNANYTDTMSSDLHILTTTGNCECFVEDIIGVTGLSRSTVVRAISILENIGYIDTVDHKQGSRKPMVMNLRWYRCCNSHLKEIPILEQNGYV